MMEAICPESCTERGLLSALCDPWEQATYYAYDPRGLQLTRRLPNQVTSYYNYYDAGQVQSLLHAGTGGLLQSLYYSYDDEGRRTMAGQGGQDGDWPEVARSLLQTFRTPTPR
ncbi:hypothetical protein LLH03_10995 [bacterium]|nr:hypothetical protein [bacterium]